MPGSWEDKFKESFTSLFIEGVKTMIDPKVKVTAEIIAQMACDRYENWDTILQRWATILMNSEDYDVKKNQEQIQAKLADHSNKECFKCGKLKCFVRLAMWTMMGAFGKSHYKTEGEFDEWRSITRTEEEYGKQCGVKYDLCMYLKENNDVHVNADILQRAYRFISMVTHHHMVQTRMYRRCLL